SGSRDADGRIVSYTYAFGDGSTFTTATGGVVSHVYTSLGAFTMTLTVTDNFGATSSDSTQVTLRTPTVALGNFRSITRIGGVTLGSMNGPTDAYVAKYASTCGGNVQWVKSFGSSYDDAAYGLAVDGNGDVIATGYFRGSANFGGGLRNSNGPFADVFIVKY